MKRLLVPCLLLCIVSFRTGGRPSVHNRFGPALWKYRTGGKIFSSPLLYRNLVVFGSEDKALYALDALTGRMAWKFTSGGPVYGSPAIMGDKVFFVSYDGNLYALDVKSGRLQWKFRTGGEKRDGSKRSLDHEACH